MSAVAVKRGVRARVGSIIVRLAGGLGNQLFQIAAAQHFRARGGDRIALSTASLAKYATVRSFDAPLVLDLPGWFRAIDGSSHWDRFLTPIVESRVGRWSPWRGVSDRNFARVVGRDDAAMNGPLWLDGYFQNEWTHDTFERVRREMLDWVRPAVRDSRGASADCVVHIRGGDFLKSKRHHVLTHAFYESAMYAMRRHIGTSMRWVCMTDDTDHAAGIIEHLCNAGFCGGFEGYAGSGDLVNDFGMLRNTCNRIVGNSTFAWWARALDDRSSFTLSPSRWSVQGGRPPLLEGETCLETC
jgi:hypothetical protein